MKKLLLTLSVIAGLLNNAFAIDLISVATNGKSNENSLGVKTLNNQEMSEVIGGASLIRKFIKDYGIVSNSGQNISYTAYYKIDEISYADKAYINLLSNEIGAVEVTYDFRTNKTSISIVAINATDNTRMRILSNFNDIKSRITNFDNVKSWIQTDKANIKYFR